jgi:uncharacterized protein (TIGR03437 family)
MTAVLLILLAGALAAQTATVQNAASVSQTYESFLYANSSIVLTQAPLNIVAPGMVAVLSGPNLPNGWTGTSTLSIRPAGSSTTIRLEALKSTPGSVTFVVPRNMPLGGAEIEYKVAGQPTAWTNVNVVAASFEFFRIGSGGPVIAQSVAPNGSLSPIGLTTPAQPGQTILLTGSGLGSGTSFNVTVGGLAAPIVPTPSHRAQPGPDEILILVPAVPAVPDGCYVPLVLTYGLPGREVAVTSTISKTSNGLPCVHPFQLSVADMKTLDGGGALTAGQIDMSTSLQAATSASASRDEIADVMLTQITAAGIASYFAPGPSPGCVIDPVNAPGFAFDGIFDPGPVLDLGALSLQNTASTLALSGGPFDYSATLAQPTEGPLTNPPAPVIASGNWTWSSSGGKDLTASAFTFSLSAPFLLTGGAPVSFASNRDQTLTWNAAAFDAGAVLTATLSGTASVTCSAPANSGTLTVPVGFIEQFGQGTLGTLQISLSETGGSIPHAQFKLQNGATLLMFVNYSTGETLPADFE